MKLKVNGQDYEQFISASANIRLDALANTFSFEATTSEDNPLPFKGGETCQVVVDDQTVLTGRIEVVNVDYSNGSHSISVQGRDKTGDLLDSTLQAIDDLRAPITLKGIIQRVLDQLNLKIEIIENVQTDKFNPAEDVASPEAGENAFEFIEKYARKRQVLLSSDGNGNIVITRNSGQVVNASVQNIIGANNNNVISASASYDTTGRYNLYKMASAMSLVALNNAGDFDNADIVSQEGTVTDEEMQKIANTRQLVLIAENPNSSEQDVSRARWEADVRQARGRVYSAVVDGYRDELGNLWDVNKLYTVRDEFADIDAQMLINTVNFTFDLSSGQQTNLTFVASNAYTLSLEEPKTDKTGVAFLPA